MASAAEGAGPLAGLRVIDLTAMVMGPYCTQILADVGADVIKIEPPGGDNTRYISVGPVPGMSGVFVNVNRGKRSVLLDLRCETDCETLRSLIATADVFRHSMRAKAKECTTHEWLILFRDLDIPASCLDDQPNRFSTEII